MASSETMLCPCAVVPSPGDTGRILLCIVVLSSGNESFGVKKTKGPAEVSKSLHPECGPTYSGHSTSSCLPILSPRWYMKHRGYYCKETSVLLLSKLTFLHPNAVVLNPGHIGIIWRYFWLEQLGIWFYWYLVGGVQEYTSHECPHNKDLTT